MTAALQVTQADGVLEVIIDRPKANAIDAATSRALGDVFASFRDDDAMHVAILSAAGERFFSPGWDLKAASEGEAADADWGVGGFGGLQELKRLNKPVIAAVNGIACGGGFEMMIACDIIIAAEQARFALPEINVGVLADAATIKLRRRVPYHVAAEFLMTGRWMEVQEAKHWGLVNEIVDSAELMTRARAVARTLAEGPPLVLAAIKDVLRSTETVPEQEAFDHILGLHSVQRVYGSEDLKEGSLAFVEKRKPNWQGR